MGSLIPLYRLDKIISFKILYLDKEILFKVSGASVVLFPHLDKEISFKKFVGFMILLYHPDNQIFIQDIHGLCDSIIIS